MRSVLILVRARKAISWLSVDINNFEMIEVSEEECNDEIVLELSKAHSLTWMSPLHRSAHQTWTFIPDWSLSTTYRSPSHECILLLLILFSAGQKTRGIPSGWLTVDLRVEVDVTSRKEIDDWLQLTVKTFGRLDGAANCAGIMGPTNLFVPLTEMEDEQWHTTIAVNLTGI